MIPLASDLLPFPGADAVGRPFGVRQSPNRLFFIGPHCDCGPHSIGSVPGVVVIAVDNIAKRCKQATESLGSDRSRENAEDPHRALAGYRKIPAQDDGGRPEENAPALGQLRDAQTITERLWEIV